MTTVTTVGYGDITAHSAVEQVRHHDVPLLYVCTATQPLLHAMLVHATCQGYVTMPCTLHCCTVSDTLVQQVLLDTVLNLHFVALEHTAAPCRQQDRHSAESAELRSCVMVAAVCRHCHDAGRRGVFWYPHRLLG